ncbi:hypothetical protein RHSIM_RhsimUnG0097400 [Rhododendron simsii]|uniref:Uncharacterized protein n=1 Tax=Rhododendron simsii TaxID=118357 RepID=A0A834FVX2_RHOSS|nr:hypothetical protein RHSIM_RhsimUnG0097400 [Rhododendron simsii]
MKQGNRRAKRRRRPLELPIAVFHVETGGVEADGGLADEGIAAGGPHGCAGGGVDDRQVGGVGHGGGERSSGQEADVFNIAEYPVGAGKSTQEGLPSDKFVRAKKKKGRSAYTEEVGEKRQRGVKLPKIGYTAEEWLTPLRPEEIPIPITIVDPSAEDMSRRNIPRPVIPTKSANPARTRGSSDEPLQQKEKRQKTSADVLQSGSVQRSPIEKGRTSSSKEKEGDVVPEPHIDLTNPEIEAEVLRQFSPSYTMPDGRVLLLKEDSGVKEEPNLAVTLLRGLALPRDYDQVPTDLMPGLAEMCSHLVQAGQAALKAYDKASKVSADRERFRNDRESFRAKWRSSDQQVKEKEDEVKHLNKELADAKAAADSFAAELKKMKEQEREKIQEADAKGYEAGIKRAALEYTQVAHKMVNDELEVRLPDFFKLGYAAGADAWPE